jgi:hypothetical protein
MAGLCGRMKHATNSVRIAVAVLLATALLPAAAASGATLPPPTLIAAAVTSPYSAPCDPTVCAVPAVIVKQGDPFVLTLTLTAAGQPAAFNKDTVLSLTAPGPGSLSAATVTISGGVSTQQFTLSYAPYANGITVTARVVSKGKPSTVSSTPSNAFDVLQTLKTDSASPGVGFADGTGLDSCAVSTATSPVCGYLILPNGSRSGVLLSSGSCAGIGCNGAGLVAQVITDMGGLYSPTAPATLIIKCYRTICGKGGINKYTAVASQDATGSLTAVPACPSKGVVGAGQRFCTDYVQSSRDGADNLLLYVLFLDDFRGSIG